MVSYKYHLKVPVECAAFTLCSGEFHEFDQKLPFSLSRNSPISDDHGVIGIAQHHRKFYLRVSVECAAFTLCYGEFHDFDPVSSGAGFSEQASPDQMSMMLMESQNIIEVPFKGPS